MVLLLTGFPVNVSMSGFVRNLFNPGGTSFAASMVPLCVATLILRAFGVKTAHLDILNSPYRWDKCSTANPWSSADEKDMSDMAKLIEQCGFRCIFSLGHLATDKLRALPGAKNVGIKYGLEKDRFAFVLGSGGTTLVFTGFHPQVLPPPFRSSPPQPPPP